MKRIKLPKFDPLGGQVSEGVIIEITEDVQRFTSDISLETTGRYYDEKAEILVDALMNLPQGIFEPLIVKLMQQRISLYCGRMGT